jgi:hypothetical protein
MPAGSTDWRSAVATNWLLAGFGDLGGSDATGVSLEDAESGVEASLKEREAQRRRKRD